MKLLYATSITLPSYRANRIQVAAMARAWANLLGGNFMLGIGGGEGELDMSKENVVTMVSSKSFILAWRYLRLACAHSVTHIYCREEKMLVAMILLNRTFFRLPVRFYYELHHLAYTQGAWRYLLLNQVAGIVSITRAMKDRLVQSGYPADKIFVAPDAVDLAAFGNLPSKEEARRELDLPLDKKIVMYTGDIDIPWKGAGVLHEAAGEFDEDYLFVFVGSKPHHIEYFRKHNPQRRNVAFAGHQPHERIPLYLASADVLVLPNSGKDEVSRISTSPMKLFEYMAAGRPIVASNIPSICEILNGQNAVLVGPNDPHALARGIREALEDVEGSERRTRQAREEVAEHTWERRAKLILSFLNNYAA